MNLQPMGTAATPEAQSLWEVAGLVRLEGLRESSTGLIEHKITHHARQLPPLVYTDTKPAKPSRPRDAKGRLLPVKK